LFNESTLLCEFPCRPGGVRRVSGRRSFPRRRGHVDLRTIRRLKTVCRISMASRQPRVARSCPPVLRALERRRIGIVRQRARAAADQSSRGRAGQLQKNSTKGARFTSRSGFLRGHARAGEKSPDLEVNVLVSMENVTARVVAELKTAKTAEEEFARARRPSPESSVRASRRPACAPMS